MFCWHLFRDEFNLVVKRVDEEFAFVGVGRTRPRTFYQSPRKKTPVPYTRSRVNPTARPCRYGEEKHFLPFTVFILQTVPPAESILRIKGEIRICGRKKTAWLGHYIKISAQRIQEQRSSWTDQFQNYESISGIHITRREVQTSRSATSEDVFNSRSLSPTAYKNKYPRKRKRCQGT